MDFGVKVPELQSFKKKGGGGLVISLFLLIS